MFIALFIVISLLVIVVDVTIAVVLVAWEEGKRLLR
jgi:hypothetical protein